MKNQIIVILMGVLLLVISTGVHADTPIFPQSFHGTLEIDGNPAPLDTRLIGKIDGADATMIEYSTNVAGFYGNVSYLNKFHVLGDSIYGAVSFHILIEDIEYTATESVEYDPGAQSELNLTFFTEAEPEYCISINDISIDTERDLIVVVQRNDCFYDVETMAIFEVFDVTGGKNTPIFIQTIRYNHHSHEDAELSAMFEFEDGKDYTIKIFNWNHWIDENEDDFRILSHPVSINYSPLPQ